MTSKYLREAPFIEPLNVEDDDTDEFYRPLLCEAPEDNEDDVLDAEDDEWDDEDDEDDEDNEPEDDEDESK